MSSNPSSFINSDEAARLLGISKAYLYKLTHQRKIPCYKPRGGVLLFDAQELDEYVRTGRVKPQKELAALADDYLNDRGRK